MESVDTFVWEKIHGKSLSMGSHNEKQMKVVGQKQKEMENAQRRTTWL